MIPDKITEPKRGASTCALGNHACKVKSGDLAMKEREITKPEREPTRLKEEEIEPENLTTKNKKGNENTTI